MISDLEKYLSHNQLLRNPNSKHSYIVLVLYLRKNKALKILRRITQKE